MKTLIVGDLHLKARVILPLVDIAIQTQGVQRVIFVGDYVDDWYCQLDIELYLSELDALVAWKQRKQAMGLEIVMLLGNHDAPYLVDHTRIYSLRFDRSQVKAKLMALDLQVAYLLDGILVSHAGFAQGEGLQPWYLKPLPPNRLDAIDTLERRVSIQDGGFDQTGSPLWLRPNLLMDRPNLKYRKQIFGHTPQTKITLSHWDREPVAFIDVDNFNLRPMGMPPYVAFHGAGELLLVEDGVASIIPTGWDQKPDLLIQVAKQRKYDVEGDL